MKNFINIGNKLASLKYLKEIKEHQYAPFDLRIVNSHITDINKLIGRRLIKKDALYINSETLWEIMQPQGHKGRHHNQHGLTENDVHNALANISEPYCIYMSRYDRCAIVSIALSHFSEKTITIIEINADLTGFKNAGIYKIITMYPKSKIDNILKRTEPNNILYKK